MDNAGTKRENCQLVANQVTPTYTWRITKPDGTTVPPADQPPGSDNIATVVADQPGTYSCTFIAKADRDCPPGARAIGPATAQAPDVTGVEWVVYPGNTALDGCPNNGGKRIFPDKTSPTDAGAANRRLVDLVAHTSPAKSGCSVYFRVWDVDDPFDQNNPALPDVSLIDVDASGPDNRGTAGGLTQATVPTDANGKAVTTFNVSLQPGDNFRAGASVTQAALDGVTQTQADDKTPPSHVHFTDMLTVWRKLHVETDTMVRPTFVQNTWIMDWNSPRQGPASTQVVVKVDDPPTDGSQTDDQQFTRGFAELQTAPGVPILTASIVDYKTYEGLGQVDDEITVNITGCGGGMQGLACLGGITNGKVLVCDDDISVPATFSAKVWGCDDSYASPVGSLAPPDLSLLVDRYKPAYVEPVQDAQASAVQGLTIFLRNQGFGLTANYGKALWDQAKAARNLPVSTSNYWTVMVVSAWQAEEPTDFDPDSEAGAGSGITWGINTHDDGARTSSLGSSYTGICAAFKAVLGEVPGREKFTVAHEIGHTFGLPHNVIHQGDPPIDMMDSMGDGQLLPLKALNVKRLREYVGP
jgi:hypothetical protein